MNYCLTDNRQILETSTKTNKWQTQQVQESTHSVNPSKSTIMSQKCLDILITLNLLGEIFTERLMLVILIVGLSQKR